MRTMCNWISWFFAFGALMAASGPFQVLLSGSLFFAMAALTFPEQ